jgi:uncharacterized protein YqgC (DUF456 family)
MENLWWLLTVLVMLLGIAGTIIPIMPGATLILGAALVHRFVLARDNSIGWKAIAVLIVLYGVSIAVDFASSAMGAKRFGASRLAMIGSVIGAFVGIFLGPFGIILGPLGGALIGEVLAQRSQQNVGKTIKVGYGTFVGTIVGIIGRMSVAVLMVATFVVATTVWRF